MDEEHVKAVAARDQFWASLRVLLPEIEQLAEGSFQNSPRDRELAQLLARVVIAELEFQADEGGS